MAWPPSASLSSEELAYYEEGHVFVGVVKGGLRKILKRKELFPDIATTVNCHNNKAAGHTCYARCCIFKQVLLQGRVSLNVSAGFTGACISALL